MKTMKRIVALALIFGCFMVGQAFAANVWTPAKNGNGGSVVLDGTLPFDLSAQAGVPKQIYLEGIIVKAGTNGYVQMRDGSATGAIFWPSNVDVLGAGQGFNYNGILLSPYIVGTECSANAVVTFIYSTGR